MANGTDSEDKFVVLSKIRVGLKREFEFALKVQSEICGSLGRTRARKAENNVESGYESEKKKLKMYESRKKSCAVVMDLEKETGSVSAEEAKRDVVDVVVDEVKVGLNNERKRNVVDGELMCVDVVEKEKEGENNAEILMNVEEGKGANDQMEGEKNEFEKGAVGMQEEKNEMDKVSMDFKGDKCEEQHENDKTGEEINEVEKAEVRVEEEENEHDKVLMDVEGDKCKEVDKEQENEHDNTDRKVVNAVVERPLRRFTRSLLQKQAELANKCLEKDSGKESDLDKVANGGDNGVGTPLVMKSKKVMRKFYTELKNFLDSGILEGISVKYIRGSKVKGPGVRGLRGVIKGSGILCFCGDCKGNEVVTPAVFELHSGSSNKRPAEYIYLENGNTLRDVMNACRDSPLEKLEEAVRTIIGSSSMKKSSFCLNCRGPNANNGSGVLTLLCNLCIEFKESQVAAVSLTDKNSCVELKEFQAGSVGLTVTSDRSPEPNLAQKSSHSKMKIISSKNQGKITRKDLRMHKLVFEEGGLQDGTEVAYFVRGQKLLVGYKIGFGILCCCCNSEVSPSQFEAHAGMASRRKPFQQIYTSNGVSLHEYSIKLSREKNFSTKENDDLCGICMDGGDLLCCDSCPRAFHTDCVSLPGIPSGPWYCRYCQNSFQRERFVEHNANAIAAGRVVVVPANRCIRIVQTPDTELGGCVLCRGRDFCKSGFGRRTVILCDQCEREYHVGCLKDHGMEDLKELPKGKWLCSSDCKRINSALQKLVDRGEEKLPETSLDVIKKHQENVSDNVVDVDVDVDVRWRVLRGKKVDSSDGTRALLSKAVSIFHDCFDPIIESASKLDLIPSMVYGRNHKGQDYHGMYCAILTVNQVVVSAGIFRIFGQELAELPLVATSTECQGQGYFQCLFSCIEKLLGFLNIKTLVLPSASEAQAIWTNKFSFNMMTQEEQNKYKNDYPLMTFRRTSMLQKPVPKCRIVSKSVDGRGSA